LKLTKRQLSLNFNVSDITIYLWDRNKVRTSLAQIPKKIEFLFRDPFEKEADNLGDKLREYRRVHELALKKLASQLGIDQTTLASRENALHWPSQILLDKFSSVFIF